MDDMSRRMTTLFVARGRRSASDSSRHKGGDGGCCSSSPPPTTQRNVFGSIKRLYPLRHRRTCSRAKLGLDCTSEDTQALLNGSYDRELNHLTEEARCWLRQAEEKEIQPFFTAQPDGMISTVEPLRSTSGSPVGPKCERKYRLEKHQDYVPDDYVPDLAETYADIYTTLKSIGHQQTSNRDGAAITYSIRWVGGVALHDLPSKMVEIIPFHFTQVTSGRGTSGFYIQHKYRLPSSGRLASTRRYLFEDRCCGTF
jgi:hypothetical protein